MKAVTLLCGIVFTVAFCAGAYNLSQYFGRFHLTAFQYLSQIATVLGHGCLAAFFFTLYSRQQSGG